MIFYDDDCRRMPVDYVNFFNTTLTISSKFKIVLFVVFVILLLVRFAFFPFSMHWPIWYSQSKLNKWTFSCTEFTRIKETLFPQSSWRMYWILNRLLIRLKFEISNKPQGNRLYITLSSLVIEKYILSSKIPRFI